MADYSVHDAKITAYYVDINANKIKMETDGGKTIEFFDVMTHRFECILECNIIFDISEHEIANFIKDNAEIIKKLKNYCWPVVYDNENELAAFLEKNGYKYITVTSSYGLNGFVLAKGYKIVV